MGFNHILDMNKLKYETSKTKIGPCGPKLILALLNEKHTKTHTTIILKDLDVSLKTEKRLNEQ